MVEFHFNESNIQTWKNSSVAWINSDVLLYAEEVLSNFLIFRDGAHADKACGS